MLRLLLCLSSIFFISTSVFAECETRIDGVCVDAMELMQYDGIGSDPAVSPIGSARQYFDPISGKLKCSEDGNAYVDCVGTGGTGSVNWSDPTNISAITTNSGWTKTGTNVALTTATDNVGIGSTTPTYPLDVAGIVNTNVGYRTKVGGYLESSVIKNPYGMSYAYIQFGSSAYSVKDMMFSTNNVTRLVINSNGKVGVGTTAPVVTMDVTGRGTFGSKITSRDSYGNTLTLANEANNDTSLFIWQNGQSAAHIGFTSGTSTLRIANSFTDGALTNPASINLTSTGNVGIGTISPTYKIDLKGLAATDGIRSDAGFDINPVVTPGAFTGTVSAGGSVDTGLHYYYITYYTAIGETAISIVTGGSVTTTAGNNTVTLTLPVSTDYRVIGRKIYRSKVGSSTEFLLATVANNTDVSYVDTAADSTLSTGAGTAARRENTTSKYITLRGTQVAQLGSNTTYFGLSTLGALTTGGYNTGFGSSALAHVSTGSHNIGIGYSVMQNNNGSQSIGIGNYALRQASANTNSGNVCVGVYCLYDLGASLNDNNVAYGNFTGRGAQGKENLFLGYYAGYQTSNRTVGAQNIAIGYYTGRVLGTGAYNTLIGAQVELALPDVGAQLNIGNVIYATGTATGSTPSATGNVGIGTYIPQSRLNVKTGTATSWERAIRIEHGTPTTTGNGAYIEFASSTAAGYGAQIGGIREAEGALNALSFRTGTNSPVDRMRITDAGNIGMGTTVPRSKLEVGTAATVTDGSSPALIVKGNVMVDGKIYGDGSALTGITGGSSQWTGTDPITFNGNVGIGTSTTPTNKLKITGNMDVTGNVGIGSTIPRSALDVNGTVTANFYGAYVDRGDVQTSYDFANSSFTADSTYRDLDLSSIVPAGARAVLLHTRLTLGSAGYSMTYITKGFTTTAPLNKSMCYNATSDIACDSIVYTDANRVVQYRISSGITWSSGGVVVRGWWK